MSLYGTHTGAGLASTAIAIGLACTGSAHASRGTSAGETCGRPGYSYAGYQSATTGHGIAATVSVGAPNGRDGWIQAGLSSFSTGGIKLYVEVTEPGSVTRYRQVEEDARPGIRHRLAVLEVAGRANW